MPSIEVHTYDPSSWKVSQSGNLGRRLSQNTQQQQKCSRHTSNISKRKPLPMILGNPISFFCEYLLNSYTSFQTQVRCDFFGDVLSNLSPYSSMFLLLFYILFHWNLNISLMYISHVYLPCDICHPSTKQMAGISQIMEVSAELTWNMTYYSNVQLKILSKLVWFPW